MNKATYAVILALVGTMFIAEGEFMPSIKYKRNVHIFLRLKTAAHVKISVFRYPYNF